MVFSKINKLRKNRGFTIVELLIVIVVIGILAAIVIVAYTGISVRANASASKANAQSVQSVAEAYAQDTVNNGLYAASAASLSSYTGGTARIPSGVTLVTTQLTTSGTTTIQYTAKGTTGACIGYWDPSLGTPAAIYVYAGNATAGTNAAAPTCA